jgi:hypothetical protein
MCAGRGEEWWMGGEKVSECECNGRKKKNCEGVKWEKIVVPPPYSRLCTYRPVMRYSRVIPRSFDGVKFGHKGGEKREGESYHQEHLCERNTPNAKFFPPFSTHVPL